MTAKLAAPPAGKTFELDLLPENLLFRDFHLFGRPVFPPMVFFELLIKIAREELAVKHPVFCKTTFHNSLLPREQAQIMRLDFAGGDAFYKVVVTSRPAGRARGQGETLHLMTECRSADPDNDRFDGNQFKRAGEGPHEIVLPVDGEPRRHLRFGPLCQTEGNLTFGAGETLAELHLSADQQPLWSHFQIPPAFLQTAFHIAADNGRVNPAKVLLPKTIDLFEAHQALGDNCSLVFPNSFRLDTENEPPRRLLDFALYNPYGNLAVRASGITLEAVGGPLDGMGDQNAPTPARTPVEQVFAYQPTWVETPLHDASPAPDNLVVFANEPTLSNALSDALPGLKIRFMRTGEEYGVYTEQNIGIRPDQPDHYERALDFCLSEEQEDLNLVYLWGWEDLGWEEKERVGRGGLQIHTLKTATQLYYLTRAAKREAQRRDRRFRILCLIPSPLFEGVAAFAASVHHEEPRLRFRIIKVDSHRTEEVVNIVTRELDPRLPDQEPISYLRGTRMTRRLSAYPLTAGDEPPLLQARDTYLITGGSGFVGSILAEYLGTRYRANLVLVAKNPVTDDVSRLMERIEKHGGRALYHQADVSDPEDMYTALADGKRLFGTIDGVFHCAGCRQGEHANQDRLETFESVIWPKVNGTLVLDQVLSGEPLKFFITFSSFPGPLGGPRSPFSSLADGFQAGFAAYRQDWEHKQGRTGKNLALCWAGWFSRERSPNPEASLIPPLHVESALGCLEQALAAKPNQLFLVTAPPQQWLTNRNTTEDAASSHPTAPSATAAMPEPGLDHDSTDATGAAGPATPTDTVATATFPDSDPTNYGLNPDLGPSRLHPTTRERQQFLLVAAACCFPGGKDRFALSTKLFPEDLPNPEIDPLLKNDPDYRNQPRLFLPQRNTLDEVYLRLGSFRTSALDPRLAVWLASARQALDNAGLNDRMLRQHRLGIFLAVSWSLWDHVPHGHANKLGAYAAHFLGASGPAVTLVGEGAGGSQAVQLGLQALAARQCDFALVGAVNLLPHNEADCTRADRARIPAEASVAMVLAENDLVEPRSLPALAEFLHFDVQFEARNRALSIGDQVSHFHQRTNLRPNQITHVEWAGDSSGLTPWRAHLSKSYTAANALGGPSVRELIGDSGPCESLLSMLRAVNWLDEPMKRTARAAAGSNDPTVLAVPDSYAAVYGVYSDGTRAQFCLTPATPARDAAADGKAMVFLTSATNHACLSAWVKRLDEHCRNMAAGRLARIAVALRARQPHPCRLAVIASSIEELHQLWHDFLRGRTKQDRLFFSGSREEDEPHHTAYTGLAGAADLWVNGGDPIWPDAENLAQVRMLELPSQPTAKHAYSLDAWLHRNPITDSALYAKTMSLQDIAPLDEPFPPTEEPEEPPAGADVTSTPSPAQSDSTASAPQDDDLSPRERIKRMQLAHADTQVPDDHKPVVTIKDLTGEEAALSETAGDADTSGGAEPYSEEEQYLATHLPEDMGNFVGYGEAEEDNPTWFQSGPDRMPQFSPDDTIPPDEFPDFHADMALEAAPAPEDPPESSAPETDTPTDDDPNTIKTKKLDAAALDAGLANPPSDGATPVTAPTEEDLFLPGNEPNTPLSEDRQIVEEAAPTQMEREESGPKSSFENDDPQAEAAESPTELEPEVGEVKAVLQPDSVSEPAPENPDKEPEIASDPEPPPEELSDPPLAETVAEPPDTALPTSDETPPSDEPDLLVEAPTQTEDANPTTVMDMAEAKAEAAAEPVADQPDAPIEAENNSVTSNPAEDAEVKPESENHTGATDTEPEATENAVDLAEPSPDGAHVLAEEDAEEDDTAFLPETEGWDYSEQPAFTERFHQLHWGQQKRPLFFLPSLDGSCNWAQHLAKGPLLRYPFHLMAAPGVVDDSEPQSLLRPIAAEFADYAQQQSGGVPPVLIAWSSGSTLLFETCRHLRRAQQNCVLILIDGLIPGGHAIETLLNLDDATLLREQAMILSAALEIRSQGRFKGLDSQGRKGQLKQVAAFLSNQTRYAVKKKALRGLLDKRLDRCHFYRKNILKHRLEPTFAPVPLYLYNSSDQNLPAGIASIWRSLMNGVDIHEWTGNCRGEHLFYEPNISFLCRYLEQELAQMEDGKGD